MVFAHINHFNENDTLSLRIIQNETLSKPLVDSDCQQNRTSWNKGSLLGTVTVCKEDVVLSTIDNEKVSLVVYIELLNRTRKDKGVHPFMSALLKAEDRKQKYYLLGKYPAFMQLFFLLITVWENNSYEKEICLGLINDEWSELYTSYQNALIFTFLDLVVSQPLP